MIEVKAKERKRVSWHETASRQLGRHNHTKAECPHCGQSCRSLARHLRRNCQQLPKESAPALNPTRAARVLATVEEIERKKRGG